MFGAVVVKNNVLAYAKVFYIISDRRKRFSNKNISQGIRDNAFSCS